MIGMRILSQHEQYPWRMGAWQLPSRVDLRLHPDEILGYADPANITDPDKLAALKSDIQRSGIHTPLVLATDGHHAELNDGHHRAQVARQLGITDVPVQVWPEVSDYFGEGHVSVGKGLGQWLQAGGRPVHERGRYGRQVS